MLPATLAISAAVLLACIFILSTTLLNPKQNKDDGSKKEPPGPPTLPIIGNLHMLGTLPHRSLQALAQKYGPIMSLRLGHIQTVVVSSPKAAELFLKTHDSVFASRPKTLAIEKISYGFKGVVFTEYGAYWRNMRKVCTIHLLSASKVEMFAPLRKEEVCGAVKLLREAAEQRQAVDLSVKVENLIEDITYRMILGRKKDDRFDLKGNVYRTVTLLGAFNLADFVPWLRPIDLQRMGPRIKKTTKAFDQVLEKIIEEHENAGIQKEGRQQQDFIDILLSLMHQPVDPNDEQKQFIDRTNIKAIALDVIAGALETTSATIGWALSALMKHPRVMKKLQDELANVVGMNRMVEETDLGKLNYLDMVVRETFRLYPVGPLLVPRESVKDATVDGYFIRKKSRVILNIFAIGRDPEVWSDNAEEFYPERFMDNKIDLRGHDFELIPFGTGRRGCPGLQLGLTTVKFVIAQLVHCFHWELPNGMTSDDLDMRETFFLSMPRAKHLFAVPTYRLAYAD